VGEPRQGRAENCRGLASLARARGGFLVAEQDAARQRPLHPKPSSGIVADQRIGSFPRHHGAEPFEFPFRRGVRLVCRVIYVPEPGVVEDEAWIYLPVWRAAEL